MKRKRKKQRRYFVEGEIYTALEFGKKYLKDSYEKTKGTEEETINPDIMNDKEIEEWAIQHLTTRIEGGDDEVWEIDD